MGIGIETATRSGKAHVEQDFDPDPDPGENLLLCSRSGFLPMYPALISSLELFA
jgi:hypothetical protein